MVFIAKFSVFVLRIEMLKPVQGAPIAGFEALDGSPVTADPASIVA